MLKLIGSYCNLRTAIQSFLTIFTNSFDVQFKLKVKYWINSLQCSDTLHIIVS